MGEVYRARDTTLAYDVAIKILPLDFSADAQRLAHCEREARLPAALNRPHIAAIYGVADLKLSNITITPEGAIKLIDFAWSRRCRKARSAWIRRRSPNLGPRSPV